MLVKKYPQIYFFNQDVPFVLKNKNKIKQWISDVASEFGNKIGEINFVFCSDDFLLEINQKFLNHSTYTDIISFDYSQAKNKIISGEIYISVPRVKENAYNLKQSFSDEMHRVIIHGILHFCGLKDKKEAEKNVMRQKENECLALLNSIISP